MVAARSSGDRRRGDIAADPQELVGRCGRGIFHQSCARQARCPVRDVSQQQVDWRELRQVRRAKIDRDKIRSSVDRAPDRPPGRSEYAHRGSSVSVHSHRTSARLRAHLSGCPMKKAAKGLDRLLPLTWSFRKQLRYTVSSGVVCLAVLASVVTAYLQSKSVREQLIQEGAQIADNFAAQSVLALLFAASENATDSVKATLAFPNVRHVAIYTSDGRFLINEGSEIDWVPSTETARGLSHEHSQLISESSSFLHFIAPVSSHSNSAAGPGAQFRLEDPQGGALGFVHVVLSKEALRKTQFSIFVNNIAAALVFAGILVIVLRLVVNRITSPLSALSTKKQKAGEGEAYVRAESEGPSEIRTIAQVFNY